jgi:hypothetical protein
MNYTPLTGIDSDEYALFMWDNLVGFGILNIPDTSNANSLLRIAQNFNMNQLRTSLTKIYQGYPFNSPLPPNPALANAIINEYFTPQELANPATIKLISRLSKIMSDHWFNCQVKCLQIKDSLCFYFISFIILSKCKKCAPNVHNKVLFN